MEDDKQKDVILNLEDAGCKECDIECFLNEFSKGNKEESLKVLMKHRKALLDSIHADQKRIDCLDYLIYQIQHKE